MHGSLTRPDALTRRGLLKRSGGVALAMAAGSVLDPRWSYADAPPASDLFVQVFLRGGMDAVSAVVPAGDSAYRAARPGIAVPESALLPLDGTFGLHPSLAALLPAWDARELAVVHAVGNPAGDRSHFEAQDALECGVLQSSQARSGWLDRHLMSRSATGSALRAVGVGGTKPMSLVGKLNPITFSSLDGFDIDVWDGIRTPFERSLRDLHSNLTHPIAATATGTLGAVSQVRDLVAAGYTPAPAALYPDSDFGKALRDVAQCAKGAVGLEVATVDIDGWDHHTALGNHTTGELATKLRDLAEGLAALRTDLGALWATTTVAVVSEFGRRLEENGDGGVDHGHGGLMLVLGGGTRGGQLYGTWPGLAPDALDHGDLAVTTDWRNVYAELVANRLGNGANLATVFPGLVPSYLGLVNPRTD
jgi:uncharacterized protein (DUF1501 family)